jgi:WD40 repeat protein
LNQDRESLRLHRHLTEAAHEWEVLERDAGALYRGAHLAQAREWAVLHPNALNAGEKAFLEASNELEQREAREREEQQKRELESAQRLAETETARAQEQAHSIKQLRRRAVYLFTVLVIAVIAAIAAGVFANQNATLASTNASVAAMAQAEAAARATQQSIAEANFTRAEAQRLAAEATNLINVRGSSETAALLTLRSLNLEYTPQGDAALLNVVNLHYPLQVFTGNQDEVNQVAFSPDDQRILTGSADGSLRLFDAQSGRQLRLFSGHTAEIIDIAFSPDGKQVLTGSWDQTARLWDLATGREVQKFLGHTSMVITVAFYGDGTQIMTGSEDKTLRLWDIKTGSELNQWFIEEPVSAFSLDGNYAVGYSETDNANHLWDLKTLTKTYSFTYPGQPIRYSTRFSLDGKYLLAVYGNEIVVSDVASGQELQVFRGHTDTSWDLALSPDGTDVLSASYDGTARLWDIQTGQEIRQFRGHTGAVDSVAFSSDGQRILTGGADGVVLLWDIEPHPELPILDGKNGGMFGVAFSPDGTHLATNVVNNVLQMWDVDSGKLLWSKKGNGFALWALAFSPNGEYLLSGNMDGVTTLWDAETGQEVRQFTSQGLDEINALAFSPDGKTIVAGGISFEGYDKFVPMWEVETGKELLRFPVVDALFGMSYSKDGRYVFTGGGNGVSYLWDAQTGTKVRDFAGNAVGSGTLFSPDGKYVTTVEGSTGFVVDVQTGQEIRRFVGPAAGLALFRYSPNGKFVAAHGFDGNVYLWDAQTGQELRRYPHPGVANNFTFSPDSQYLVSVDNNGIARFFDVDYRTTMKYLCSILLRDFTDDERAQYNIMDNIPTCPKQ